MAEGNWSSQSTRYLCVPSGVQGHRGSNSLSLTPARGTQHSRPLFFRSLGETSWPWWYILKQFLEPQVFSLKHDPLRRRAQCNRRATPAAGWHGGTSVSLCCLASLASFADFRFQVWTAAGFWKADPRGSLDPALNPPDFYLLAEAAVCSIAAWHCSRFCQASRLESHLPVLGQPARLFRFGTAGVLSPDGCMAASVCFASVSPRRLSCLSSAFPG